MISEELRKELSGHCEHYASRRVGLIFVMQKLQEHYGGWLPDEAIREAADIVGIPEPDVEGVATFYNWFFREPVGRKVIVCCDSISCHLCGCDRNVAHLERRLGIKMGETTADGEYTLLPVVCLGDCDNAPSMMIGDELYNRMTPEKIDEFLGDYKPAERRAEAAS
jgi:NADH-quinone oxidoreductase subunit E